MTRTPAQPPTEPTPEGVITALPPELHATFEREYHLAMVCALDPAHFHLVRQLLRLWQQHATGENVDQAARGRAELRSRFHKIHGIRCGGTLCGQPTQKRGNPPCEQFRASWPGPGNFELWTCYTHLAQDERRLVDQARHRDQHNSPIPAGWQTRAGVRTYTDPLAARTRNTVSADAGR